MMFGWVSLRRTIPHRSFATILLVFVIAISLRTLVHPPFQALLKSNSNVDPEWARASERKDPQPVGRPSLGKHTLTPDGRLVVNPDGPHPIFQLIRDAEAAWEAKCARASKTLDEAVAEYRRRYRRAPPLGFDKWWDYVVKHRVQLPDEYDEIFEDIGPLWGIDPHELARAEKQVELRDHVVVVQKTDAHSRFKIVRSTIPPDREKVPPTVIDRILGFIREIEHDIPPMHFTFYPFDNPRKFSDWRMKTMALEAAANGSTLTRKDLPPVREGWVQGCPPDSPARLHPPAFPPSSTSLFSTSSPKTFIASHRDTMDPCKDPSLFTVHGQFLAYERGPTPQRTLVPSFSLCGTLLHHDIRPPIPYGWDFENESDLIEDDEEDGDGAFEGDVPWEYKTNERLGWRGRTTGMGAFPDTLWKHGQRARLVTLTNSLEGNVSVLRVPKNSIDNGVEAEAIPVGEPESIPLAQINPVWMDVAFTDEPVGCDGGSCEEMARMWVFREVQERDEEGRYKFILDVDGNGWSGRFKRLVTSHALIFKATIYPEWYTSRVAPWVHYVPIQVSYADLYDTVSFFREHDELARRIARAGREWSRRFWRRQDMTAYTYRLLLEYARVMSFDRAAMDYVG
ncbi:glycosyl transferase family 90-domain-containing protein [Boletus edulis]|nr:glycosyl transferase family 90-domain-containing protein [Boletus edulis]